MDRGWTVGCVVFTYTSMLITYIVDTAPYLTHKQASVVLCVVLLCYVNVLRVSYSRLSDSRALPAGLCPVRATAFLEVGDDKMGLGLKSHPFV